MVFFTASPFLVRSLSVRALVVFFGFVSVLCGAGLLMSRAYPSQPVPLAKASVLNTTGSTELPALSQRGQ